jgi:hypothetical protein
MYRTITWVFVSFVHSYRYYLFAIEIFILFIYLGSISLPLSHFHVRSIFYCTYIPIMMYYFQF